MKIPLKADFEPCPEYQGRAVCVDVTDLQTMRTQYGEQEKFFVVFEIDMDREDAPEGHGSRWCVWSVPFTPSFGEKANFRKFLAQWWGRALTVEELETFDTEDLIGRPAQITVGHEEDEAGKVRARILACQPYKGTEPLEPSGTFVRKKERPERGQAGSGGAQFKQTPKQTSALAKPATKTAPGAATQDPGGVQVHFGAAKGVELNDMSKDQIRSLISKWLLDYFPTLPKPTADDKRLATALEIFRKRFESEEAAEKAAAAEPAETEPSFY